MNTCGISDSVTSALREAEPCPSCGSTSRVGRGLCLQCLLQTGFEGSEDNGSELAQLLEEIDVRDADWRLGNYQILEEIGRGGMGVIYRARQRHSRRIVALKRVLSYHADSRDTLVRFRREAEAAASLDHPNILPIYEVSESEDGLPYFSMKFAPGGSLLDAAAALRDEPRRAVALMAKVARAVQYAHVQGILHRDLKPGNVLLDARGEPLVSDFGLAKWLDTSSDLTRTLTIFGTPGYIAPEQAQGPARNLTPTADVYSLGAILFDLLTGRPPFLGEHALTVIQQASEKPAPKLRSLAPHANRDLETICAKCLERDPRARYHSAGELAEDLERYLEGCPIVARPVSPPVRVWRWSRRNRKLAATACIVVALAIGFFATQIERIRLSRVVQADAIAQHSIAILPVVDLDAAGPLAGDFSQRFAEVLSASMARTGPSRVVSVTTEDASVVVASADHATVQRIAREADARTLLTATRRIRHGNWRFSVRLLDPRTGELVFRRIFDLQEHTPVDLQISSALANELYLVLQNSDLSQLKLSSNDPGLKNERARELILAGKALQERRTASDIEETVTCFTKATSIEPNSALAYSLLAFAQTSRAVINGDASDLSAAEKTARIALRLNPYLGESHRATALILSEQGHFDEAIDELLTGYELGDISPRAGNFAADIFRTLGRPDKALAWYEMAARSESRPGQDFKIGDCWIDLDEDKRAEQAYSRVTELFPYLPEGWMGLCRLALLQKDFARSKKICSENWRRYREFVFSQEMAAQVEFFSRNFSEAEKLYQELATKDPNGGGSFYGGVSYQSALGRLRFASSDTTGARRILQAALKAELAALRGAPHHPEILYRLAAIESSLGDSDRAVEYLNRAFTEGWIDYRSLDIDPRFDSLRNNQQYKQIFEAMETRVSALRRSMPTEDKLAATH
jgi:serine/threonine protein kinase/tetratricopeptide (TPR) repeat protein